MGLDCSHDAFHGAYSAFNRLRQIVCYVTGKDASFPPHWQYTETGELLEKDGRVQYIEGLDPNMMYVGDDYPRDKFPGLWEFLSHSDCDGDIEPGLCRLVADDLEALLPKVEALESRGWSAGGHLAARGGYAECLRKFIAGCRKAHSMCEPLDFH